MVRPHVSPGTSLLQRLPHLNAEELHRELATGADYAQAIAMVTDREALAALQQLPHAEKEKLPDMQGVYDRLASTAATVTG